MLPSEPYAMYNYVECNFDNLYVNDADNTRLCAANASLAYADLWKCATGRAPHSGPEMLLESAKLAGTMGIHSAPTVLLEGKIVGHTLTLQQVCDAYAGSPKPKGCQQPTGALAARAATAHGATCHV